MSATRLKPDPNRRTSSASGGKPEAAPNRVPSSKRRWVFRLAALILVPILLLAGLEGILRVAGYGYPTQFFQEMTVNGRRMVVDNPKFSWRFFPRRLARRPLPIIFPAEKPAGTYRVFVLGESAAMGDPEPAFAFSRILEVLLRERFPQSRVEVINVAFTAINSHVILPIARACAKEQGDLWVIYMGHNEVQGPFGPGTILGQHASSLWLTRASLALKTTRLGQLLDDWRSRWAARNGTPATWQGLEMFLGHQFRENDPALQSMYRQFQQNLSDILATGRKSGAEILLCTAASNLRDSAPFASLHVAEMTPERTSAWDRVYPPAKEAEMAGRHQEAFPLLQAGATVDAHYADLQFLLGHCWSALNRPTEAQQSFERARDLDTLRFRADTRLTQIVHDAAAAWAGKGVFLCDTVAALAQNAINHVPGEAEFFDHVHMTFTGNYVVARAIADELAERLPAGPRTQDTGDWASADDCAKQLGLSAWHEYQMCDWMQRRLLKAPFTNQLNHLVRQQRYLQRLAELRPALQPEGLREAADLCREALRHSTNDASLHENLARVLAAAGDNQGAIAEFRRVAELMPQHAAAYNNLGLLYKNLGQFKEAEENFRLALQRRPDFADSYNGLGTVQGAQGDMAAAIASYRKALEANPELVEAQVNLGQALGQQGQFDTAENCYLEALRLRPSYVIAQWGLADLLLREGKPFDAMPYLSEAARNHPESTLARVRRGVEARPADPLEHFKLANVLAALKQGGDAVAELETAVKLNPKFWEARYLLGVELAGRNELDRAQAQFAAVIEQQPGYARAHLNLGVAYAKQMRLQEAARQFSEVLRLESTNQTARQYLDQIQAMTRPKASP